MRPAPTILAISIAAVLGCGGLKGSKPIAPKDAPMPELDLNLLTDWTETLGFNLGHPGRAQVLPDGSAVLFLRSTARSRAHSLYQYTLADGKETLIASADQLVGSASAEYNRVEAERRERSRTIATGITDFELSDDSSLIALSTAGGVYVIDRDSRMSKRVTGFPGAPAAPRMSPDGERIAAVVDGDVYVVEIATGKATRITKRNGDSEFYGLPEFVAHEEFSRPYGFWWSPDSRALLVQRTDVSKVEVANLGDPAYPQRPFEARRYPRPGTPNADISLAIHRLDGGAAQPVTWGKDHPYLIAAHWDRGGPLTLITANRLQTEWNVYNVAPEGGAATLLFAERDDSFVEPWRERRSAPVYRKRDLLWLSETRGRRSLEARMRSGEHSHWLGPDDLVVHEIVAAIDGSSDVLVIASKDPTEQHVWRLSADGATQITTVPGQHGAASSADGSVIAIESRAASGERTATVWRDGKQVAELKSVAEPLPFIPNVEYTTVDTDVGSMHAAVILPRPQAGIVAAKLPVILYVYGGPHDQMVRADKRAHVLDQIVADSGFAVVRIDGRGTPGRNAAWERAINNKLGVVPLDDQVAGLEAVLARYPALDGERVGVYGWSFGGYLTALAVMRRPDVFAAGVAGAPVADWRDYDTAYTERYMGLPADNEDTYRESNVLTYADKLERPLLLVHGTRDDNVYFQHSLKIADALYRAGKNFELVPLLDSTHMSADPAMRMALYRRIIDFFKRHLQ